MECCKPSPWPLDHLLGMRYRLRGAGPPLARVAEPRERSFIVVEEPAGEPPRPLPPSSRGEACCLYLVAKRGLSTAAAAGLLRRLVPGRGRPLYHGLKDAEATTVQAMLLPCRVPPPRLVREPGRLWARLAGYAPACRAGPPSGNRFTIVLEPLSPTAFEEAERLLAAKLPAYYGYQRFGTRRPNTHLLGLAAARWAAGEYLYELISSPYPDESPEARACRLRGWRGCTGGYEAAAARPGGPWAAAHRIPGAVRSLQAGALQAYLFNLYLSARIERGVGLDEPLEGERLVGGRPYAPVPGVGAPGPRPGGEAGELLREALAEAGLSWSDLEKAPGWLRARGFWRPTYMEPLEGRVREEGGRLVLQFSLEQGMYATVLLRELVEVPDGL